MVHLRRVLYVTTKRVKQVKHFVVKFIVVVAIYDQPLSMRYLVLAG